ncbi:hypothetical protein BDP55DRAFT_628271 [Colletotrichum godetiae]|uniref:Uncharacterized protein n=1 Tax=Colletotrichum godetiae TaxID=1209918 RepID=A0AAJ0AST2_9PEZI|nr:uncharacterized protein BDP55DRAFT_628271 [Colletotrichum godetiae]KAK1689714.1 hypothetical protein BDP55DRAFT_628271 [Colletotrichum godetiae]
MDSSAQARQVLIADLPREGDLAHHTNNGRPTTRVRTDSTEGNVPSPNPNPNPDRSETSSSDNITSLTAQLAKLNDSLAALEDEARGEPYETSEEECRGAAGDVEALLASLTQCATEKTFLEKCFPCKGWKRRDLLRRHVGVVQETFRTVGMTHLRVASAFARLCQTADGLGEDAERLAGVVEEVKNAFQREGVRRKVLGWQKRNLKAELEWAEERMSAVSSSSSSNDAPFHRADEEGNVEHESTATTREREADVAKMRLEREQMAKLPSESTDDAHNPTEAGIHNPARQLKHLKDDRDARAEHDVDNVRLEILAASLESVFLVKHEDLSVDLRKRREALREEGERCLAVSERLEKLRKSNYGDLAIGLGELAKKPDAEARRKLVKIVDTAGRLAAARRGVMMVEYHRMR